MVSFSLFETMNTMVQPLNQIHLNTISNKISIWIDGYIRVRFIKTSPREEKYEKSKLRMTSSDLNSDFNRVY